MDQAALNVIVLAAGKGTRLKSETPKVLHSLFEKPLIERVLGSVADLKAMGLPVSQTVVVVGHERQQVEAALSGLDFIETRTVIQEPQLGTGHAVQMVRQADGIQLDGDVLVLSGDVPLLSVASLRDLITHHRQMQNELTVLTAELDNPTGYGRVISDGGQVRKIVEEKDASPEEKQVRAVNAGVYCFRWTVIAPLLDHLSADNAQGEFYLTDVVSMAVNKDMQVGAVQLVDALEMAGINHRLDLSVCHEILNQQTQARLLDEGVSILNPTSTMISPEVRIGRDTVIYPGCYLAGDIRIGEGCRIGPHTTMLGQVTVGDRAEVVQSHLRDSRVAEASFIGPFAHLRDGADIGRHVKIGNFVEVKNASIGEDSFASHLAYVGDATVGRDVNLGAGSITANFDAVRGTKHRTVVEDKAKVGSNAVLVAPVTVHEGALVAAGSVITRDVSPYDLAIARGRQTEIAGWVKKTLDREAVRETSESPTGKQA